MKIDHMRICLQEICESVVLLGTDVFKVDTSCARDAEWELESYTHEIITHDDDCQQQ